LSSPGKGTITPQATITVNSLLDVANGSDGFCTLREAITAANTNVASGSVPGECVAGSGSGSDSINVAINGTINLTGALSEIVSDMNISGNGSGSLLVRRDTGGDYRIFSTNNRTVTISGLTDKLFLTFLRGHASHGIEI
jgi:CSLREA domain-containing protein